MSPHPDNTPELRDRIRQLEDLHKVSRSVDSVLGVMETLDDISACCKKLCGAEKVSLVLFAGAADAKEKTIIRQASSDDRPIDHTVNTMIGGWILQHRATLHTTDVIRETRGRKLTSSDNAHGPALAVPLHEGTACIGFIGMVNPRDGRDFSAQDKLIAEALAPLASRSIQRAQLLETIEKDNARLRSALQHDRWRQSLIGDSAEMTSVQEKIAMVGSTNASVLIIGETGTGKELVARAIHEMSSRSDKPFIPVNCAAIPETLVESVLFGHEQGAFTGATEMKKGMFETAHRGTLFLDEISAMPVLLQPKLLRVLEERTFCRIGSAADMRIDVRVIAASNKDLRTAIAAGEFREDLYHRLNVFPLTLPSLSEREGDIPLLAAAFLDEFSGATREFSREALDTLRGMRWKGNVRELRNAVERLAILSPSGVIDAGQIRAILGTGAALAATSDLSAALRQALRTSQDGQNILEHVETSLLDLALQEAEGNVSQAARILGIDRSALQRRIQKFGL